MPRGLLSDTEIREQFSTGRKLIRGLERATEGDSDAVKKVLPHASRLVTLGQVISNAYGQTGRVKHVMHRCWELSRTRYGGTGFISACTSPHGVYWRDDRLKPGGVAILLAGIPLPTYMAEEIVRMVWGNRNATGRGRSPVQLSSDCQRTWKRAYRVVIQQPLVKDM